jgi:membrane protease YdiL (CAAX protease family)
MTDAPPPAAPTDDGSPERVYPTWSAWEALPVFGIALLLSAILSAPFTTPHRHHQHLSTAQQLAGGILVEVSLGATVLGWLYVRHRSSMRALGIPRRPVHEIIAGFLGGLALVALLVYGFGWILAQLLEVISSARHVSVPRQLPTGIKDGNTWLAAILILLAAPVCEELFFRGIVFKGLRTRLRFASAAGISAVVFGLAHLQEAIPGPWQGAVLLVTVLTLVGFGLAFIYERRGTIVATIAAHGAFNLIGFLVILHVIG